MNFFENEYTIPVILGSSQEGLDLANIIRKKTHLEIHIFGYSLSFFRKLKYRFHKITSNKDITYLSLIKFAECIHEGYSPLLIYCDDMIDFVTQNFSDLESIFIIISAKTAKNFFTEGHCYDENK